MCEDIQYFPVLLFPPYKGFSLTFNYVLAIILCNMFLIIYFPHYH